MKIKNVSILCITIAVFCSVKAQVFTEITEIAAPISGTGSSNLATIDNAWSVFVNPAGLSRLESIELISAFHKPYGLSFFSYRVAGFAIPINKKWGTIALGYETNSTKYLNETLSAEEAYRISHSFYLQKDIHSTLAIGYSFNLYHIDYGKSAGTEGDGSNGIELGNGYGFGLDFGIQGSLRERTWIGLYAKNINSPEMGSSLSSSNLPRVIAVGFGYEPYYGFSTNFVIYQPLNSYPTQYRGGINYQVLPWFIIRAGINTEPSKIGFGFGLGKWGLKFDYAFVSHPVLPETHQFSLGYIFLR